MEAGSIYVCIERGCVEAGAGATSGHLQRGGGEDWAHRRISWVGWWRVGARFKGTCS